jgi:hypothetical protein
MEAIMIRFFFGVIFGILLGVGGAVYLSMKGGLSTANLQPPPPPGQSVMHLSIDQAYLNQKLGAALAGTTEFKGLQPTLTTQAPNAVIVNVDMEVTVGGNTLKVHPAVTMQLFVEASRIRARVAGVNIGVANVPAMLIQTQIDWIERVMEEQANHIATTGLTGTGLKVINVSASNTGLLVDLGP